jgi:hypothetical protein
MTPGAEPGERGFGQGRASVPQDLARPCVVRAEQLPPGRRPYRLVPGVSPTGFELEVIRVRAPVRRCARDHEPRRGVASVPVWGAGRFERGRLPVVPAASFRPSPGVSTWKEP